MSYYNILVEFPNGTTKIIESKVHIDSISRIVPQYRILYSGEGKIKTEKV